MSFSSNELSPQQRIVDDLVDIAINKGVSGTEAIYALQVLCETNSRWLQVMATNTGVTIEDIKEVVEQLSNKTD